MEKLPATQNQSQERRCQKCGKRLSTYNKNNVCHACRGNPADISTFRHPGTGGGRQSGPKGGINE